MVRPTLPLLVLVALGTLATAGYLALSGGEEISAPPALDPGRAPGSVTQPDRLDGGGDVLAPVQRRDPAADATTGRTEVAPGVKEPSSSRTAGASGTLRVAVVRESDARPMVGARVTFLDRNTQKGWEAAWKVPANRESFLKAHGQMLVADSAGILSVPSTTSGALLSLWRGQDGTLEWSELPREPLRLILSLPVALQVQLVDGNGRPLPGATVVLTVERNGVRKKLMERPASGSTAIAVFQSVKRSYGSLGPDEPLWIEPGFPCSGDPHLEIDPHALPTEVQRLVVGDIGSLKVIVTDERGRPLQEMANVTLGRFLVGTGGRAFEELHSKRLIGGRATFANLGLGLTVALRIEGNAERAPQEFEISGPTRKGQVVEVRLDWTERYSVLVARAIDESGILLRNRGGTFLLHQGGQSVGGSPVRTDTRGELRIVVQKPGEGDGTRVLEVRLRSAATEPPMEARRELTRPLKGGDYDLGDLVFHSPPALVSGVVRDVGGRPLFGASVRIQLSSGARPGGARSGIPDRNTRTDRRGMFTIYGTCDDDVLTVVVAQPGFATLRTKGVRPGTSDLQLTLNTGGGR